MTALEIILIILIILFVGGIVTWRVLARLRKKKSEGGSSCGCGCSGCAAASACHAARATKPVEPDDNAMPEVEVQSTVKCDFSDIVAKMNDGSGKKAD